MSGIRQDIVSLTVLSGPDLGLQRTFNKERITIGRGGTNDFLLSDGFVSNFHGEVFTAEGDVVYRDLQSRHGSLVNIDNVSFHLHDKQEASTLKLNHGAEIQLGCTLIRVEIQRAELTPLPAAPARKRRQTRETLITASHQSVPVLTRNLEGADERLGVIFRLAGLLNGLDRLSEILDRIVDATFDAFPAANFFALTLLDGDTPIEESDPFFTRKRRAASAFTKAENEEGSGVTALSEPTTSEEKPIISKSILKRVVETQESVLFVKDSLGADISQSIIDAKITACLCAPLVGQRRLLGVMEVDTRGLGSLFTKKDLELFNMVASLAAFALERAQLAENIVSMFESFVHASVNAIEARDPTTAGHSERVAIYTLELAEAANNIETGFASELHFSEDELTELRYAALLHDFGKIAVREDVLQKARRLPELHLDLIAQRFETIKALAYREHVEQTLIESISAGLALSMHQYDELKARHAEFCASLDEQLEWLVDSSSVGWMSDEAVARVRQIGAMRYTDLHGGKHRFLTDFEIENFTIRRGTLNAEEWDNMRSHAAFSQDYLERIPWSPELANVPCIAGAHHEKIDGSGYPMGIRDEQLVPQVRMLTIADIFDALTASDRPYRKAASVERACSILREEAAMGKLDAQLVALFEDLVIPKILHVIPSLQAKKG